MGKYIYTSRGNPVGYIQGRYIYTMSGRAAGQLNGNHVHKLSGQYVGELDRQMIVRKPLVHQGNIGNPGNISGLGNLGVPVNRGPISSGYQDVSKELFS
jgi:hypothetical protein